MRKSASSLSKLASSVYDHLSKPVLVETLQEPSIHTVQVMALQDEVGWMAPIKSYLTDGSLPDSKSQARKIRLKALRYEMVDGSLYIPKVVPHAFVALFGRERG